MKYGAETYRVEDTMSRILNVKDYKLKEAFVTTTGIVASIETNEGKIITLTKRIFSIDHDLNKMSIINDLSRKFVDKKITLDDMIKKLEEVEKIKGYSLPVIAFATAMTCFSFSIIFGGTIRDGIGASIVGVILSILTSYFRKIGFTKIVINLLGGIIVGAISILVIETGISQNMDFTISGAIMPLVPGVILTNAVRDMVGGNLISGSNRVVTAVITSVEIAAGVAVAFSIIYKFI